MKGVMHAIYVMLSIGRSLLYKGVDHVWNHSFTSNSVTKSAQCSIHETKSIKFYLLGDNPLIALIVNRQLSFREVFLVFF